MRLREEDIEAVTSLTCDFLHLPPARCKVKDTRAGHAFPRKNLITIPTWALGEGEVYTTYYIVHELCHFCCFTRGHGSEFKERERTALREWGLLPVYAKAYPKELHNLNGETLYKRKGR